MRVVLQKSSYYYYYYFLSRFPQLQKKCKATPQDSKQVNMYSHTREHINYYYFVCINLYVYVSVFCVSQCFELMQFMLESIGNERPSLDDAQRLRLFAATFDCTEVTLLLRPPTTMTTTTTTTTTTTNDTQAQQLAALSLLKATQLLFAQWTSELAPQASNETAIKFAAQRWLQLATNAASKVNFQ